jgi:hypothetical protein
MISSALPRTPERFARRMSDPVRDATCVYLDHSFGARLRRLFWRLLCR